MSPIARLFRTVAVCASLLALSAGCSKQRGASPFDPEAGHPSDWIAKHPAAFRSALGSCASCHGDDLLGGISKISCFSVSFEGQACHPGGPGHPAGWDAPGQHGAVAKGPAGSLSGFLSCATCHGADFGGGLVRSSCFVCHGVHAPHAPKPWLGSPSTHTTTDTGNAPVCALCHRSATPGAPDCFNNTLCHGPAGHPAGWGAASQHGAAALGSPGFTNCQSCHGAGFSGGTAGQSCFPCHGWPAGQNAAHGHNGWTGGGSHHRSAQAQTWVTICYLCHKTGNPGTPSCLNNTLCHAQAN